MSAPDKLYEDMVDAMGELFGVHEGHRAAHAKGVLCHATFQATADGAALTRAAHMTGEAMRAHVRFSNGSGDPGAPDTAPDGRGMALKVYLPDGPTTDVVALTLPSFFVRTPEGCLEFTRVRTPDPETGQPDPQRMGEYFAAHPEAGPAIQAALSAGIPASYLALEYHGIHAFRWEDAGGQSRYVRYRLVPEGGVETLTKEELGEKGPAYLRENLTERLERGPAAFSLEVTLAEPGDPIDDATAAWPPDRETVTAARVEVTGLAHDRERGGDVLVFDPTRVIDGIALSDDPILAARSQAYSVSVRRRSGVERGDV